MTFLEVGVARVRIAGVSHAASADLAVEEGEGGGSASEM